MPDAGGETWPAIYLQAQCFDCGRFLFSEAYRPAVLENWESIARYWRGILDHHRGVCPGSNLEAHRELAAVVRMMVADGKLPADQVAHLVPLLNGIPPR